MSSNYREAQGKKDSLHGCNNRITSNRAGFPTPLDAKAA
eukprot:CAMPEP_0169131316 /NCGR_PEP_ID=MMETSP1015-20121227/38184_1 /TAXON_ID=342587 /ORGANISM="Karlodinium micrum, Strain CCMP2283" /LENGTH=38 /DNA_ID= /DNA_START= /DNA_END= /DNA_ORIENTATION=